MSVLNKEIICTNCFSSFSGRKVKFRCINKSCQELDPILENFQKNPNLGALGHIFDLDIGGIKLFTEEGLTARCDRCSTVSRVRICPNCHSQLPQDAGLVDEHIFAMIGAHAAGKGIYMTTLIQRLKELGPGFGFTVTEVGDETYERFNNDYLIPLYKDRMIIKQTLSGGVDARSKKPMSFQLAFERNRKRRVVNLSFFDGAGEDMHSVKALTTEANYICYASGIIFILDPLQIKGVRHSPLLENLPAQLENVDPDHIVDCLLKLFNDQYPKLLGGKIETPIAFVLSKTDAIEPLLFADTNLKSDGDHPGFYNLTDGDAVQDEITRYLHCWLGENFVAKIEKYFAHFHFFGVSSLGHPTEGSDGKQVGVVNPIRVEDPFLWILSHYRLIESRNKRS